MYYTGNFSPFTEEEENIEMKTDRPMPFWPCAEERDFIDNKPVRQEEYSSDRFEAYLQELAKDAPGIEVVRESTKNLSSLSKLIAEERENE